MSNTYKLCIVMLESYGKWSFLYSMTAFDQLKNYIYSNKAWHSI